MQIDTLVGISGLAPSFLANLSLKEHVLLELLGRHWSGIQISLISKTSIFFQKLTLLFSFNPFSYDVKFHTFARATIVRTMTASFASVRTSWMNDLSIFNWSIG